MKKKTKLPNAKQIVALIALLSACYAAWDKMEGNTDRSIENRQMLIEYRAHVEKDEDFERKFDKRLERIENKVFH